MTVNELRAFTFENYYKRIWFARENSYFSIKHLKKKDQQQKKYLTLVMPKNIIILNWREKNPHKISKTIKNNYSATKGYRKQKYCWHKISQCYKFCLVRYYLHPADHNPASITNADKDFSKGIDFKDIKFPVKVRYIWKIVKRNSIGISVYGYENNEKHPICIKKCCEKNVGWLKTGEEGKRY